jgi:hypothetical protein
MKKLRAIGERLFVDGLTREVFEDNQGQYVLDEDRKKAYGVWLVPGDEPIIAGSDEGEF